MTLGEFIDNNNFNEEEDLFMYNAKSGNGRIEIAVLYGYDYVEIKIDGNTILENETIINPFKCKIDSIQKELFDALN